MRFYLLVLLLFLLSLLQEVFLPFNLVLLVVMLYPALRPAKESLLVAFLAGFFVDLAWGIPLGLTSLVFLAESYLLCLYKQKFDIYHPLFLPLFLFLGELVYARITFGLWDLRGSLILAILVLFTRRIVRYFSPEINPREIKLRV